jgi:hypothetical protein
VHIALLFSFLTFCKYQRFTIDTTVHSSKQQVNNSREAAGKLHGNSEVTVKEGPEN